MLSALLAAIAAHPIIAGTIITGASLGAGSILNNTGIDEKISRGIAGTLGKIAPNTGSIGKTVQDLIKYTDLHTWADYRNEAQDKLEDYVNNSETLKGMKLDELIDQAAYMGYITKEDKAKYLNMLKELNVDKHGFLESLIDFSGKNTEEIARLYGILTKVAPEIETVLNNAVGVDVKGALYQSIPAIQNAPTPGYLNVDFENRWIEKEADPLKWWTGKELAEHNNLPYDVDEWYDAIKEGTEANVARDMYTSDQLRQDAIKDRPWEQAAYLSSISDTKGESVAKGATAGAEAANQVLNMLGSNQQSLQTQAQTANDRWDTIAESLRADAEARLLANQKYQNLGLNIAGAIEGLYENDVIRRQAELEGYAGLASADEYLRNARLQANADMNKAYTENQAIINSARQSINDTTNRYAWMWDRFYGRAQESGLSDALSRVRANQDFANWVFQQSTNTQNYRNWSTYLDNNY